LLISQVDHSHVAGLLAAHWGNAEFAELRPYAPMVVAAGEHDMGWWEWEIQPTLNAEGHPIDYIGSIKNLGPGTWLGFMEHGTERVLEQDPYAGLLVLMHSEGLLTQCKGLLPYMPDYSADPLARASLERYEPQRQRLVAELRAEFDAAVAEVEGLAPPGADAMFDHVYARPPARLQRQRRDAG
jgi:hypothetical protein